MRISDWSSDVCSSDLFFLGAGQEADVLADADRGAGHDDFPIPLLVHRLRQARGQRKQGLAGAGGAEQGDEVDLRIHQRVEREVLLAVARVDAPDRMRAVAVRSEEHTSELQSLIRISYAFFCLKKKTRRPSTEYIRHVESTAA